MKRIYDLPSFVAGEPFNRARAMGSSGSRTGSGSGHQRLNAFKHGMFANHLLLPGEDPSELHRHKIGVLQCLNPNDTFQQLLAERVICASWKLRRMEQAEQELYAAELKDPQNPAKTPGAAMVRLMRQGKPGAVSEVERIQKYQQKLEGTINRNIQLLHKLQGRLNGALSELTAVLIEEEEAELKKIDLPSAPDVPGCGQHDENEDVNVCIEKKKQRDALAQQEMEEAISQDEAKLEQSDDAEQEPQQEDEIEQQDETTQQDETAPTPQQPEAAEDPTAAVAPAPIDASNAVKPRDFRDISAESWNKTDEPRPTEFDAHRLAFEPLHP